MPSRDPDLEIRGRLIRSRGSLREMLPGSFVERKRAVVGSTVIALKARTCTCIIRSPC